MRDDGAHHRPELTAALKRLRLGGILPTLPERTALAEKDSTPFDELLLLLLVDKIERRKSTAARNRAEVAGLDPDMVVERWDKTAKVHFDKRVFQEFVQPPLCRGRAQRRDPRARGGGEDLSRQRARPPRLSQRLQRALPPSERAAAEAPSESPRQLARRRHGRAHRDRPAHRRRLRSRADDARGEPRRLPALRRAHRRASSVVTSNRATAEWLTTFDDTLLAQSAIDRFQNAAYDLVIEGESYRSRLKPTIDKAGPPPERPVEKKPLHPRQKRSR